MVEILGYWLEIDERGFVLGYSSTMIQNGVELLTDELPGDFETHFSFYRLGEDLKLVYDRTRVDEMIAEQEKIENTPTREEILEETVYELEREKKLLMDRTDSLENAVVDLLMMTTGISVE